jgi:hypothetical protein
MKFPDISQRERAKELLLDMQDKIEVLKLIEVGLDFDGSDRAYHLALITEFDTKEDLKTYASHSVHLEVVNYLKSINTVTKVVDYEL